MIPKKSLGQHFLVCGWVTEAMIACAELTRNDTVLEIGPGTGALTRSLAHAAGRVIAVEKDERLAAALTETLVHEGIRNVTVVPTDIFAFLDHAAELLPESYQLIANLPYYLTAHLMRVIFKQNRRPERMILTMQEEVAERIAARPPHMSLLTVAVQAYGRPRIVRTVPASCFTPPPKVTSAILAITNISDSFFTHNQITEDDFFAVLRTAFAQRRKTLANTLRPLMPREVLVPLLEKLELPQAVRAEALLLEQWLPIVRAINSSRSDRRSGRHS